MRPFLDSYIYGLPFNSQTRQVVVQVHNKLRTFMEFYCATEHFGARFFRVGIRIDKQKPPRRGIKLRFPSNQSCYVVFKDEHLPSTFYYTCGKVGPYLKDCDLVSDDEDEPYRDCKYGEWIR
jgi:hypothetical protein